MRPRLDTADVGPPSLPWRTTLTLSMALHVLGFGVAIGLPRLLPRPALRPVYVVDLVALPGGPATDSPPPPAAAAPKAAAPSAPKKDEKAITIPEPRKPKPEAKKTPEPKKTPAPKKTPPVKPTDSSAASETGAATSPSQAPATDKPATTARETGVPGGTGAVTGGFGGTGAAAADAMTFYASLVRRNIENAWKKPIYPPTETGRLAFTIQIRLTLTSSGRMSDVKVLAPSGYEAMDRSVLAAVNEAMFPPFPSTLGYPSLPFTVEIVLTPD